MYVPPAPPVGIAETLPSERPQLASLILILAEIALLEEMTKKVSNKQSALSVNKKLNVSLCNAFRLTSIDENPDKVVQL